MDSRLLGFSSNSPLHKFSIKHTQDHSLWGVVDTGLRQSRYAYKPQQLMQARGNNNNAITFTYLLPRQTHSLIDWLDLSEEISTEPKSRFSYSDLWISFFILVCNWSVGVSATSHTNIDSKEAVWFSMIDLLLGLILLSSPAEQVTLFWQATQQASSPLTPFSYSP